MANIGELTAKITGDTAGLDTSLRKSESMLRRSARRMQDSLHGVTQSIFSFKNALIGTVGLTGMGLFVKKSLEMADRIGKVADKVGISTEALQELRHAATLAGVETRTLDMAMQRFSRRIGEAAQGQGELKDTLEAYNISVFDASGRTRAIVDILGDIANVMKQAGGDTERLRIAFKAFDSEGAALVNMLRNGRAQLEAMREDARRLGIVMSDKMIRSAERANDELYRLSQVLKIQLSSAVVGLAPIIAGAAQALTDWITDVREKGDLGKWAKAMAPLVVDAFQAISYAAEGVMMAISGYKDIALGFLKLFSGTKLAALRSGEEQITSRLERLKAGGEPGRSQPFLPWTKAPSREEAIRTQEQLLLNQKQAIQYWENIDSQSRGTLDAQILKQQTLNDAFGKARTKLAELANAYIDQGDIAVDVNKKITSGYIAGSNQRTEAAMKEAAAIYQIRLRQIGESLAAEVAANTETRNIGEARLQRMLQILKIGSSGADAAYQERQIILKDFDSEFRKLTLGQTQFEIEEIRKRSEALIAAGANTQKVRQVEEIKTNQVLQEDQQNRLEEMSGMWNEFAGELRGPMSDILSGEFGKTENYFSDMLDRMRKKWADLLADMVIKFMMTGQIFGQQTSFGGLQGLFKGPGIPKGPSGGGVAGVTGAHAFQHGGLITEPVFGVGRSGATYSFGERGPERIEPARTEGGEGGRMNPVTVNISTLDSRSFQQLMSEDPDFFASMMYGAIRNNHSLRKAR